MAEEGSLELAPLRAKVILDLSELNDSIDEVNDMMGDLGKNFGKNIVNGSKQASKVIQKLNKVLEEVHETSEEPIEMKTDAEGLAEIQKTIEESSMMFDNLLEQATEFDEEIQELANTFEPITENLGDIDNSFDEIVFQGEQLTNTLNIIPQSLATVNSQTTQTSLSFLNILDEVNKTDDEIQELSTHFEPVVESAEMSTQALKDATIQAEQLQVELQGVEGQADSLSGAFENIKQGITGNASAINDLKQQMADIDNQAKNLSHDFIINFNGQQIHAIAADMEDLTTATNIYQDALARITDEQANFESDLSLDYYTIEEFQEEIKIGTQSLEEMIEESKGLNVSLDEVSGALNTNIPLWKDLTEEQQAEFKEVGELEYNLQALQSRLLNIDNAIGHLGDAMETAQAKQERLNHSFDSGSVDVLQYNAEAMEFIENASEMASATQKQTKANSNNSKSLTKSQQAMQDYTQALADAVESFGRAGVKVDKLQALYKDLTKTQKEGTNQFAKDSQAISNNMNRIVESYQKLDSATLSNKEMNEGLTESIDRLALASSTLQESLDTDQMAWSRMAITTEQAGLSFNSATDSVEENAEATESAGSKIRSYGENWWTTATMAIMSIQMITSSVGDLLKDGSEVQLSGIGIQETFGKQGAQAIENFTKSASASNLTLEEMLPTAETLGLALRQYGGSKTEIAGVTTRIMEMANQLQLATGGAVSFSQGVDAIRQELAGQSYALKSLGINISTTLLNQTALNSKWHEAYKKMSSYQQAVIKVDALQGQLNKTFGKTSKYLDSQAGQYQKNLATFKNDAAKLGEALLPLANAILPEILKAVNKVVAVVNKIKSNKWLENKIEWYAKLAVKIGGVVLVLGIIAKAVETAIKWWERMKMIVGICTDIVVGMDPITLGIAAIIAACVLLYEAWEHNWLDIRGITKDAIDGITSTFEGFGSDIQDIWTDLTDGLTEAWNYYIVGWGERTLDGITDVENYFGSLGNDVVSIFSSLGSNVVELWDYYIGGLPQRAEDIVEDVENIFSGLLSDVEDIFSRIGSSISQGFSDAGSDINKLTGGIFMAMPTGLGSVPTVNSINTTNITTNNNTLGAHPVAESNLMETNNTVPTIGELHIHSPHALDPIQTYNQMQQFSINMANGIY